MCGCSWRLTDWLTADWVSEWVSEQLNPTQGVSRRAREANVGVNREMWGLQLGTIGCIMDVEGEELEREAAAVVGLGWDGLGWGLSRDERQPPPRGPLTQRAVDMEALCGLNYGLLAAGARATKKKDRKRKKIKDKKESDSCIHPSIHASTSPCILPSLSNLTALCTALSAWSDHCYSL